MGNRTDYAGLGIGSLGVSIKDKDYQRKQLASYMFCRTQQMFGYDDLPDTIPAREVEKLLQTQGYLTGFEHEGNLWVDKGGFSGTQNEYYLPKESIVVNPYIGEGINKTFTIGKDCVVIKNDSYYLGLSPMFNKYAEMMATNEITMYNVDILARIQALLLAGDSNARKQADAYIKSILKGDLSFINSNSFADDITTAPFAEKAGDALTNLIEYEQYLKASWLNEIGLNANWNAKRESVNSNEAQLNGDFLLPLIDDMLECRQKGWDEFNKMFGTHVRVYKKSSWEDVENRESIESEADANKDDKEEIVEEDKQNEN